MKLFSIELDNINGILQPRVELDYRFKELEKKDIIAIHEEISKCYQDVMKIYISKKEINKSAPI
ncbi:hypothetical protein CNEO2_190086 [Clostridium neonatale]|uniref:hypothetical protein n=1 Tax=Clostridium neonatale TaxID=137838 RepID=UPI00291B721A|nr:hypothetical protein [Clostridium neonatale]CAI3227133.1 hypothetical protein CNEO2_190086 [Clostridium neonatale]